MIMAAAACTPSEDQNVASMAWSSMVEQLMAHYQRDRVGHGNAALIILVLFLLAPVCFFGKREPSLGISFCVRSDSTKPDRRGGD